MISLMRSVAAPEVSTPALDSIFCLLVHILFSFMGIFPVPLAFVTVCFTAMGVSVTAAVWMFKRMELLDEDFWRYFAFNIATSQSWGLWGVRFSPQKEEVSDQICFLILQSFSAIYRLPHVFFEPRIRMSQFLHANQFQNVVLFLVGFFLTCPSSHS